MQTRFKKLNISSVKGSVPLNVLGLATLGVQISGTWSGTLVAEGSLDGENWVTLQSESGLMSSLSNGVYISGVNGYQYARVRATAWTSGTAQVYVIAIEESHSSSNPKVTYNATPPTLADGESGSLQGDVNGNLNTTLATGLTKYSDSVEARIEFGTPILISADGQISATPGRLVGFYVNSTSSGVIKFGNATTATNYVTGDITPAVGWHSFPAEFTTACWFELVSGTISVTVIFISE